MLRPTLFPRPPEPVVYPEPTEEEIAAIDRISHDPDFNGCQDPVPGDAFLEAVMNQQRQPDTGDTFEKVLSDLNSGLL